MIAPALQPGELVAAVSLADPMTTRAAAAPTHFTLPLEPQDRPSASLPTSSHKSQRRSLGTAVAILGTMLTAWWEPSWCSLPDTESLPSAVR